MQVPELEAPSVQAEPLPGRPFPRISEDVPEAAFGGPIAAGIDAVSSAATQEQAKQKVLNDNLRVMDANTQLEAAHTTLLYGKPNPDTGQNEGGAFSLHGKDAINLPAKLIPEYQKAAEGISATLTPDQQRIFSRHIANGANELNTQLNRYEYEESQRLAAEVYSNGQKQAVEGASVGWRDPLAIGKARLDIKGNIALRAQQEGWPQSEVDAETTRQLGALHYAVVDRMLADGAPQAALHYFVGTKAQPGIRDSGELTGEQAHALGASIDSAVQQQRVQMQAGVAAKLRDVSAAYANGQLVDPKTQANLEGQIRMAFPDTAAQVIGDLRKAAVLGADVKNFATMDPKTMMAHVESYKPTGVEDAAAGYERYNTALQAALRVQSQRAADPMQAIIDNKLGAEPLDFKDPKALTDQINTRLAAQQVNIGRLGGYVPPLTKGEAQQFAALLENQKPQDRVATLAALNQGITSSSGYQQVMQQIMPHSPVMSVVGSQIGHADPHQDRPPVWFNQNYATSPDQAALILTGEALLNPQGQDKDGEKRGFKGAFPMPAEGGVSGLRTLFAQATGNLFAQRPELADVSYAAFKDAYAALLAKNGNLTGQDVPALRKQAMSIALGHITQFNGGEVAVPQGMDPTTFNGHVAAAVDFELARQKQDPATYIKNLSGYRLQELGEVGSGHYRLMMGNEPIWRPDGKLNPDGSRAAMEIDIRREFGGRGSVPPELISRAAVAKPDKGEDEPAEKGGGIRTGGAARKTHPSQAPAL